MADVVIIGAGYAGMSAAALLAHAGLKVIVLEESGMVGGRAHSCKDEDGYIREYGAHSHRLARQGIANEVFIRLGEEIDFLPEAKDAKLIFKGRLWERPAGAAGFLKTPMLSFRARLALLAFLVKIKKANPDEWYDKTLLDFYRTSFQHPEVEAFLPFFGMTVMCPQADKVSAGEVIDFLQRALAAGVGVGEPRGGSLQLFSTLKKHVEENGCIHLHEKVFTLWVVWKVAILIIALSVGMRAKEGLQYLGADFPARGDQELNTPSLKEIKEVTQEVGTAGWDPLTGQWKVPAKAVAAATAAAVKPAESFISPEEEMMSKIKKSSA